MSQHRILRSLVSGYALGAVSPALALLLASTALQGFLAWCMRTVAPTSRLARDLHRTACPGWQLRDSDIEHSQGHISIQALFPQTVKGNFQVHNTFFS